MYQGLDNLAQLLNFVRGARTGSDVSGVDSELTALEPHWSNVNRDLTALVQQVRNKNWKFQQQGVRALVESALGSDLVSAMPVHAGLVGRIEGKVRRWFGCSRAGRRIARGRRPVDGQLSARRHPMGDCGWPHGADIRQYHGRSNDVRVRQVRETSEGDIRGASGSA